jgi:hypothetical protein
MVMDTLGLIEPEMEEETLTAESNAATMKRLMKDWHLGPEKASEEPKANKPFWSSIADVWGVDESVARRQLCANCEYFDNTPAALEYTDRVPFNETDADGGGRGFCHKFDFICHNLRTCQAWEEKPYMGET